MRLLAWGRLLASCLRSLLYRRVFSSDASRLFGRKCRSLFLGSEETERYSEECLRVAKQAPAASGIRLLWMHTNPFWVEPLRKLTDFNPKVQIVGCDMVELSPPLDPSGTSTATALKLLREMLLALEKPYLK